MMRSLEIQNFRCFKQLTINDCRRINVIVGDNGIGKTALLEAIFLTLGSSIDLTMRFQQQRGLPGNTKGTQYVFEQANLLDLFYHRNTRNEIGITIQADGPDARSLAVRRSLVPGPLPPTGDDEAALSLRGSETTGSAGRGIIVFAWTDANGITRSVPDVRGSH